MPHKMVHFYIQRKRNKKNHEAIRGYIAFILHNTTENKVKHFPQADKYNISGIYQIKCLIAH
jgi:hypothetical protein